MDYTEFAQRLYETNTISDPWIEGNERFRLDPIVLEPQLHAGLVDAADRIGALIDDVARIVWDRPDLLDSFFAMSPYQKAMWIASGGRWHGIARLDLFVLKDGSIQCCEVNSDTPSGEAEAVLVNRILHDHHGGTIDPNIGFEEKFVSMSLSTWERLRRTAVGVRPRVGIVYPTDLPEDLSMIAMYRQWMSRVAASVVLGSPYNIHQRRDGGIAMFDQPIDLMIRHYKTDWWGERLPVWLDAPAYNDPDPLDPYLGSVLRADTEGLLAIVNPFGSVLTQNKLTLAFMWEHFEAFGVESQRTIRDFFPRAQRLRGATVENLSRAEWVLKSDYGCEGEEVVIGPYVTDEIWTQSLLQAVEGRWMAQRFFQADEQSDGSIPNYGVYLIAGRFAGYFTRLSRRATDYTSVMVPTYVRA